MPKPSSETIGRDEAPDQSRLRTFCLTASEMYGLSDRPWARLQASGTVTLSLLTLLRRLKAFCTAMPRLFANCGSRPLAVRIRSSGARY